MNLQGHAERSIGTAWMISFGNTGGIVATFAFISTDGPLYIKGYSICLAMPAMGVLAATLYGLLVLRENSKLRATAMGRDVVYYSL